MASMPAPPTEASRGSSVTARRAGDRRLFTELFILAQLLSQSRHDFRHVQLENRCIRAHKSADVNRRGETVVVALFQCAQMVGPDFGDLGDLINGEASGLARGAELFGHCGHDRRFITIAREYWQSGKKETRKGKAE